VQLGDISNKGNNMRNAPMNTSGHGMDKKWAIR
jgi:hypothetical protein